MSTPAIVYNVFATGIDSTEGAPVTAFALAGRATFSVHSHEWAVLPELRGWIRAHGGAIEDETGAPVPVEHVDEAELYIVSLGPWEDIAVQGVRRVDTDCPECGLPVVRVHQDAPTGRAAEDPSLPVVATARSCWLVRPDVATDLGAGVVTMDVATPGGHCTGCWPERLLASDPAVGSRCGTCLAVARVPTYSLGLLVERPDDATGWWWYSRLGQHLPILSGEVVTRLRAHVEISALPVLTDPATAFLPEELR